MAHWRGFPSSCPASLISLRSPLRLFSLRLFCRAMISSGRQSDARYWWKENARLSDHLAQCAGGVYVSKLKPVKPVTHYMQFSRTTRLHPKIASVCSEHATVFVRLFQVAVTKIAVAPILNMLNMLRLVACNSFQTSQSDCLVLVTSRLGPQSGHFPKKSMVLIVRDSPQGHTH